MKKNIVFILGAGSSKDFGFPLGDEIFAEAHNLLLNTKSSDIKSKLKITLTEVERIKAQIFSRLPSDKTKYPLFEEVLTFIWHSKKYEYQDWKNYGNVVSLFDKLTKEVFATFVEMLALTFSGIIYSNDFKKELKLYETFIKSLNFKTNNISFISLNYDLLIDTILLDCVKEGLIEGLNYGIGVRPLSDEIDRKKDGMLLLKPHGSLNLSFCTAYSHGRELFYYSEGDITIDVMNESDRIKCRIDHCGHYVKPLRVPLKIS